MVMALPWPVMRVVVSMVSVCCAAGGVVVVVVVVVRGLALDEGKVGIVGEGVERVVEMGEVGLGSMPARRRAWRRERAWAAVSGCERVWVCEGSWGVEWVGCITVGGWVGGFGVPEWKWMRCFLLLWY